MKLIKIHLIRRLAQGCALAVMLFGMQGAAQAEDHITGKVMNLAGREKLRISHCCRKYNPLYSMSVTFNEGNWEARQTPDSEYPMYSGSYLETTNPNIYYMRMNEDDMENGLTSQIESLAGMDEMELDVKKYRMWLR